MIRPESVKGMRDILPLESAVRDALIGKILSSYRSWGFERIETPVLERIDVLLGSKSGENEKMIFKILKRGEKLAKSSNEDESVDSGLRFDLTVPLSRFIAANVNALNIPFKALQIGPVFRAERPQKGRFRQFTQCDLDVIGVPAPFAELELVLATSGCLANLGFKQFTVRINDKRILHAMCQRAGFGEEDVSNVLTILDKTDKIGIDGVQAELLPYGEGKAAAIRQLLLVANAKVHSATEFVQNNDLQVSAEACEEIDFVIAEAKKLSGNQWSLKFDPTLVRGMGYYTGMVFEITHPDYSFSFAGGGRYDDMIGRFLGRPLAACGFSIGFERLVTALTEQHVAVGLEGNKVALLVNSKLAATHAYTLAAGLRSAQQSVTVLPQSGKKVGKYIDQLYASGYTRVAFVAEDGALTETRTKDIVKIEARAPVP